MGIKSFLLVLFELYMGCSFFSIVFYYIVVVYLPKKTVGSVLCRI